MFVPDQYRDPESSWPVELVAGNPLALLISAGPPAGAPFATSVPIIMDPACGEVTDLAGITLLGHMNRANPHWRAIGPGTPAIAVFSGPNAYVSPTVYELDPAAPTWNFTSVHVHGTLHPIDSPEESLEVVRSTVRAFEGRFGGGWDMTSSVDYFRKILPGVGAYRVKVTKVDSMFKLSQEQEPEVRDRVRRYFAGSDFGRRREVAALMAQLDEFAHPVDSRRCPVS
ncbi:FMN-binding negative transcriptional regulator [Streptosporangiaceae bacterium NEAU-GS5]|nr:FMN-binding negative transcriptional regulator [Streptosporangiaceae bacterium NEAU-GS5]